MGMLEASHRLPSSVRGAHAGPNARFAAGSPERPNPGVWRLWSHGSATYLAARRLATDPTLLAAISDVAHHSWRASAVGVYRLWRDAGFAVGALLAGLVADLAGLEAAVWVVAALTAASGLVVAVRMYETHRPMGQS